METTSAKNIGKIHSEKLGRYGLYSHSDYRSFLKSFYQLKKSESNNWSYGAWARKLDISSKAVLANVLNGHRHPGPKLATKLSDYFGFNKHERHYFDCLIRLRKSEKDPQLMMVVKQKLGQLHPAKKFEMVDEHKYETISEWYHFPIRELTRVAGFQSDPKWIQSQLYHPLSIKEIQRALDNLLALGLIAKDSKGNFHCTEENIVAGEDILSSALRKSHEDMVQRAKEAVLDVPAELSDISNITMCMNKNDIETARDMITEFRQKFITAFDKDGGEEVYQLNVQLFPLSHATK